jgi:glyoxalase family protein
MASQIPGIHHVTAICGDPQRNLDFYSGVLGLRFVKRTVNFDDPASYHLYYGDAVGSPGTIMTFFAWPGAPRGRRGVGQLTVTAFAVPERSLAFWGERLGGHGVAVEGPLRRGDEEYLALEDPDGLRLELVGWATASGGRVWADGPVPPEHAIRGFFGVSLCERDEGPSAQLLTGTLGFALDARDGDRFRYRGREGEMGSVVDLLHRPEATPGTVAVGTVHHVAWRARDDEEQRGWRSRLVDQGLQVTPIIDRRYFRSIYFREPGGVLFEIATEPPGFTVDEPEPELGSRLQLPPWLEPSRARIEAGLPPIEVRRPQPEGVRGRPGKRS